MEQNGAYIQWHIQPSTIDDRLFTHFFPLFISFLSRLFRERNIPVCIHLWIMLPDYLQNH